MTVTTNVIVLPSRGHTAIHPSRPCLRFHVSSGERSMTV